ncbi:MAG: hydrogenase maturation protease [Betaproteobacteria bacterium]|nr:MAG: hydrogenase maturation protease [Betaproteobacteria bacterium]
MTGVETVPANRRRQILIGVGNPDRGDDGAGRMVVQALAGDLPEDIEVLQLSGEATDIVGQLQRADAAILIDACSSGAAAGTAQRFDVVDEPLPRELFAVSTHGVGVADAIELARALGDLPAVCLVYAIEGKRFDTGEPVSAPVAAAVPEVAAQVRIEFQQLTARERCDA